MLSLIGFTCASFKHCHKVQISLLRQPSVSYMTCIRQILEEKKYCSELCHFICNPEEYFESIFFFFFHLPCSPHD